MKINYCITLCAYKQDDYDLCSVSKNMFKYLLGIIPTIANTYLERYLLDVTGDPSQFYPFHFYSASW